jgi:2-keto-3-deoxy-L-fuconate dehydrogenase
MADRLRGKRALLTAAGQGIGRATALAFAREGARVIATDLDAGKLAGLDQAGEVIARKLDVRAQAEIDALARELGAVDVLFNCAGFVHQHTVLECSERDWDFAFDLNVKSMHRMIKAFLPAMLENGGGSIINMASVVSSLKGAPNRYVYGATKAAVIGLTKAVALDFIAKGIRCNAICPGTIQSPSLEARIEAVGEALPGGAEAARQGFVARQPMGRLGTAEEVAALAVYLASDEAAFTTGAVHVIDGGFTI